MTCTRFTKYLLAFVLLGGVVLGALFSAGSAAAASHETGGEVEAEEGAGEEAKGDLTEAERQALLQEIARQLDELEREVAELSLLVNKYVLEKQAVALQERIEQEVSGLAESVVEEPAAAEETAIVQTPEEEETALPEEEEDVFAGIEIESGPGAELPEGEPEIAVSEQEEPEQGFFAAVRTFGGNLGTPELATIAILAFLAAAILFRRLRERRAPAERKAASPQGPFAAPHPPSAPTSSPQETLEGSRQELKERISWQ